MHFAYATEHTHSLRTLLRPRLHPAGLRWELRSAFLTSPQERPMLQGPGAVTPEQDMQRTCFSINSSSFILHLYDRAASS